MNNVSKKGQNLNFEIFIFYFYGKRKMSGHLCH